MSVTNPTKLLIPNKTKPQSMITLANLNQPLLQFIHFFYKIVPCLQHQTNLNQVQYPTKLIQTQYYQILYSKYYQFYFHFLLSHFYSLPPNNNQDPPHMTTIIAPNTQKPIKTNSDPKLSKLYRLYTTNNIIRSNNFFQPKKKKTDKPVIDLVFPNPNFLFIHPQIVKDPTQIRTFMQLNMMKNIVERKKHHTIRKTFTPFQKPATAPIMGRRHYLKKNLSSEQTDSTNLYNNLEGDKQNYKGDTIYHWRKSKTFILKTKVSNTTYKENAELNNEKESSEQFSNGDNVDSIFEGRKKTIILKYQQDKISRENLYQRAAVKGSKTQLYLQMESKLMKYVKNY